MIGVLARGIVLSTLAYGLSPACGPSLWRCVCMSGPPAVPRSYETLRGPAVLVEKGESNSLTRPMKLSSKPLREAVPTPPRPHRRSPVAYLAS